MIFEISILVGFTWLVISIFIGLSNPKNKGGPDAVKNYFNANEDIFKLTKWLAYGLFGMGIIIGIGHNLIGVLK